MNATLRHTDIDFRVIVRFITMVVPLFPAAFSVPAASSANIGLQVNGNCATGSCPAQPLVSGSSASLPFSSVVTIGNGDALTGGFTFGISSASSAQACAAGVCLGPVDPPGSFNLTGGGYSLPSSNGVFSFDNAVITHFGDGSPAGSYVVYSALTPPKILSGGVVPVYSSSSTIQPGSWVSIYGTNLAVAPTTWNGEFPTSLGGVSVTINSKPAYLWFVSPTQINLQAPDDISTGVANVVVTTLAGTAPSTVTVAPYAPSFSLLNNRYATAIVLTPGSPGNSGGGYDIIGPTGAFSYPTRPVRPGEIVELYGVGFGPTNPFVPAGKAFSGAAASIMKPEITIGGVPATVNFAGIVEAGLFQFDVVVPEAGSGDRLLKATIGGVTTQDNVFITALSLPPVD